MRKSSVIAMVVLLSGLGLWYASVIQRGTNTRQRSIAGNLIVEDRKSVV